MKIKRKKPPSLRYVTARAWMPKCACCNLPELSTDVFDGYVELDFCAKFHHTLVMTGLLFCEN